MQELKSAKSAIRRKAEIFEEEEETTARQREQILADLRKEAESSVEMLDAARRRAQSVSIEVAELRGKLAHITKDQATWETDLKVKEEEEMEGAMNELRRLRHEKPDSAARIAHERQGNAHNFAAKALK